MKFLRKSLLEIKLPNFCIKCFFYCLSLSSNFHSSSYSIHENSQKVVRKAQELHFMAFRSKIASESQCHISIYARALACRNSLLISISQRSYLVLLFFGACMCSWMQIACYFLSLTRKVAIFIRAYFAMHDSKVKQSILRRYEPAMVWVR